MVWDASAFDQRHGHGHQMFMYGASAFDQDLGWCVDDGVSLDYAFDNTPCYSTSCGVNWAAAARAVAVVAATSWTDGGAIRTAVGCVALGPSGRRGDVRPYFYVGDWGVTDMDHLFCGYCVELLQLGRVVL